MVNTHPNPSTACSIEEHELIFALYAVNALDEQIRRTGPNNLPILVNHFLMTSLCYDGCFHAWCHAKAQGIQ